MSKDLVISLSPTQKDFVLSDAEIVQLIGPMGEGKCLNIGTKLICYDGSVRRVEEIVPGDLLMGDDSTSRRVLSVNTGVGELFRVVPFRGEPFVCNADHILSLKRTRTHNLKRGKPKLDGLAGSVVDIPLSEYRDWSKWYRDIYKLYRVPLEFPEQKVDLDPYFLGIWLGDGDSRRSAITTPEPEVVSYLDDFAAKMGLKLHKAGLPHNKAASYHLSAGNVGGKGCNPLLSLLQSHSLIKNKHIPQAYKTNSREVRMALLAGLVDSDGYLNRNSYQFTLKSERLSEDLAFLCRSLGFAASVKPVVKTIKDRGFSGTYYQVGVSGDLSGVPVRVPRKKAPARKPFKNVLTSGIKEIVNLGKGVYYGFILNGNCRFLLGDCTVTHNTFAACAGLMWHAKRCRMPIRGALIRDTHVNIKTSTAPSITEVLGARALFKDNFKKLFIKCNPPVEMDLFGIDDPASISKLQGPQYAIIWLEEPAPIYERANAGLPKEVFDLSVARASRQKGTHPRVQITHNPADAGHWVSELAASPREYMTVEIDGQMVVVHKDTFRIPKGENKTLSPLTRAMQMAAFRNDPAKWARYIEGKEAEVHEGETVMTGYDGNVHFSQIILPVYPNLDAFRGWDGDMHPSCITAQYNPTGQLVIHDVLTGDGIGPKELIEEKLMLLLASGKYKDKIPAWRDIGDPSMRDPDRSTNKTTAAKTIEAILKTRFEAGPTRWLMRKDPTNYALKRRLNEGKPAIVISASAFALHQALKGGWRYKTDNSANVVGKKPIKNAHDHVGNAFAYLISMLMPYDIRKQVKEIDKVIRMQRALSYGSGWHKPAAAAMGGMR